MKNYIYQKFLLNCDYKSIDLANLPRYTKTLDFIPYAGISPCILDFNNEIHRKVSLEYLDNKIDNLDDWNSFTNCLDGISTLIIYDFKLYTENPIISNYRIATLQAYIYHLKNSVQNLQIFLKETLPVNSAA